MPISVLKIGRQRSLSSVAKAVFDLDGASPAKIRNAQDVLVRANPHLADEGALKAGTNIVVPDEPGLSVSSEREAIPVGREGLVDIAVTRASAFASAVASASDLAKADFKAQAELLANEDLIKAFTEAEPSIGREIGKIRETAAARAKAADAESALLREAVQHFRKDMEKDAAVT